MPSPETEPNGEDPDLLLHKPASEAREPDAPLRQPMSRRHKIGWLIAVIVVLIPVTLTLASALTSPPHVNAVPVGHLIYLEADAPSTATTLLRGLRIMGTNGASRQLLQETEPQGGDNGVREWITQPKASPDGKWLAFEKQVITIEEEQHSVINQLWAMPLTGASPKPHMLLDLTKQHLKQIVGLAWSRDSQSVVFLQDSTAYFVPIKAGEPVVKQPLTIDRNAKITADTSATRNPYVNARRAIAFTTFTSMDSRPSPPAVAPDGREIATVSAIDPHAIAISGSKTPLRARWGWSALGPRHITALRWSPDAKYLAYSVSKPPFEDELFYIDIATGHCFQLPVRVGQAGWDWTS